MPDNFDQPSHALMREVAARAPFRDKLANASAARETIGAFADYYRGAGASLRRDRPLAHDLCSCAARTGRHRRMGQERRDCGRFSTRSPPTKGRPFSPNIATRSPSPIRRLPTGACCCPSRAFSSWRPAMKPPGQMVSDALTLAAQDRTGGERNGACRHISRARSPRLVIVWAMSGAALAQDQGSLTPVVLPPLANPADPKLPAKEVFGRALTPTEAAVALDRLLCARLSRRRQGAAGRRRDVAGDAPVARSQLGQSGDDFLPRDDFRRRRRGKASGRAFWSAIFRSRAAARC